MRFIPAIFLLPLLITSCQSVSYHGPRTDHYDGSHFYNPASYWTTPWSKSHLDTLNAATRAFNNNDPVKFTFINHDTILLQSDHFSLLTDPIWSYRASPLSWFGPARHREPAMKFEALPPINVVIISHSHYDHMDMPTLIRLNDTFHPVFIVPLGCKGYLEKNGIHHVVELDWWQSYRVKNAVITMLPAHHWSWRYLNDKNKTLWASYGISVNSKKIYFAGDTGYDEHFKVINKRWGTPDIAFMPIGSYLPRNLLKSAHMNPHESIHACDDIHAVQCVAIHYGTFKLGDDSEKDDIKMLKHGLEIYKKNDGHFLVLPLNTDHQYIIK